MDCAARPYAYVIDLLKTAGIRPTRQRLSLAKLLFEGGHKHVTAESLFELCVHEHETVSLATIYNSLHQFKEAGLLREITLGTGKTYYDTNMEPHYHFYHVHDERLEDIEAKNIKLSGLPDMPQGTKLSHIDVVLYVD